MARQGHACAHEHAGQQLPPGVFHLHAQQHITRTRIDIDAGEQDLPGDFIRGSIATENGDWQPAAGIGTALAKRFLHRFERRRRATDIDIDLVDLLDTRHRVAVRTADQCPLGYQRLVDASGDRRIDRGVFEIELLASQGGLRLRHVGGGLVTLRHCIVIDLTADRIGFNQRGQPVGLYLCTGQGGFCSLQRGGSRISVRGKRRRIDLEQRLTGAHFSPLFEHALLHDTADLGANLRYAHSLDPTRKVLGQVELGRHNKRRGHLGRWRCAIHFWLPASCQHQGQGRYSATQEKLVCFHENPFRIWRQVAGHIAV